MNPTTQIYVGLLDEAVEAWRPVLAEHVRGDIYRILPQPYDRDSESWAFEPGDYVVCKLLRTSQGEILAATLEAPG